MYEWTVHIALDGLEVRDDESSVRDYLVDQLQPYDAVMAYGGDRLSATFTFEGTDAGEAMARGRATLERALDNVGLGYGQVTRLEVEPADAEEPPPGGPLPELVGLSEAAEILGVSKTRVGQLVDNGRMPKPVLRLAATPVWLAEGVRAVATQERRPGRPRVGV